MRSRACLLAIVLLLLNASGWAEKVALPATAPAQKLGRFFEAFNSGNEGKIRKFISANYTPAALAERDVDSRASVYLRLYEQTHGFDLRAIADSQPSRISAVAQSRLLGDWMLITVAIDAAAQDRVTGFIFRATPRPPEFTPHIKLTSAQIAAELGKYVDHLADAGRFSGVVLLAGPNGSAVLQRTVGHTAEGAPVTLSTPFGLASIGKTFTAVAVAQLAAAGKLSFEDRLSRFLPGYPKPAADQITLRELLTHTAGLSAYMDSRYFDRPRTFQEHQEIISRLPLSFPPGTKFQYSNAGYLLLRGVVSAASGEAYEDYLQEHIFEPAGMKPQREAFMTASDLLRFASAFRDGRLLSPQMRAIVTSGKVPTGEPGVRYAFGLEERALNGETFVGHAGGAARVSAEFQIYDSGYIVVVMSDRPDAASPQIAIRAADLITQK